ncbi:MAG: serine hydroxymethyltransferase [Pseudomonadota bacterium]
MPAQMHQSGYLLEFVPARGAIKVSAIDPITGTEVSIVGSPAASQAQLERVAVQKLEYVLTRDTPAPLTPPSGRGIIT